MIPVTGTAVITTPSTVPEPSAPSTRSAMSDAPGAIPHLTVGLIHKTLRDMAALGLIELPRPFATKVA